MTTDTHHPLSAVAHTGLTEPMARGLTGRVTTPASPDYARLATPWNLAVDSRPVAVVEVADARDVSHALRFAADHGLRVDVRATGHGATATVGPTLLLLTTGLDEITVHPSDCQDGTGAWFRAGAGVRWQQVLDAATPLGLAPLCGAAPGTGVVGLLTGGGLGPLNRTYGFSSDHVRAFEVVTGDGRMHRATPDASAPEDADLYWALCGGKGALGVVTAVEVDLPSLPEIYGGAVVVDGDDAPAVLHAWARWASDLPETASTSVALQRLPEAPGVPAALAGRLTLAVRFACTASAEVAEQLWAPLARQTRPVLGRVGPMPYAAVGSIHSDPVHPMPTTETAHLLAELPPEAVDALLATAGPGTDCAHPVVELRRLGGACSRVARPSCLTERWAAFSLLAVAVAVPPLLEANAAHAATIGEAVAPWTTGGAIPNFGGVTTADSAARAYSPPVLRRLAALSEHHDPHGVLTAARPVRTAGARLREALPTR